MSTWEDRGEERMTVNAQVHYFAMNLKKGEVSLSYNLFKVFLHLYSHTVDAAVQYVLHYWFCIPSQYAVNIQPKHGTKTTTQTQQSI